MKVDEKEFFREATLRICGSLEVETFFYESFMYIRDFIPADHAFLTHYYPDKGKQLALAKASTEGGSRLDITVSIPSDAGKLLGHPGVLTRVIDRAEAFPPNQPWISEGLLDKNWSLLSLRLSAGTDIVGAVIFTARASGSFSQEHANLLSILRKPFAIALSNSLKFKELLELKELLIEDNRFLHSELRHAAGEEIIGADFGLRGVMEMVRQVAPLSSPIVLLGETGTGKEVIAGAIHNLSQRKDGPIIKVNCGAIPESLMDSELFGHEKGAFTGALSRKRGRFERANGGTIFLDEVGELQPEAQVRLLRVLQDKEIERVGGNEPVKVDIRVIAATHRDLEAMIRDGKFREDLYFRLKVFPIIIPPLRERKTDISSLVHHFMQKKSREMGLPGFPTLAPGALERLTAYHWPGNVRELENAVERELILSRGMPLAFNDLKVKLKPELRFEHRHRVGPESQPGLEEDSLALDTIMSEHIRRVLKMTSGRVGGRQGAAHLLKINPSTLRKRMRKLEIPFGRKTKKN